MIELLRTTSSHPDFQSLITQLDKELWDRYPVLQAEYAPHNKIENISTVIVAYNKNKKHPVGCGCFKALDATTVEIKRMFVESTHREQGIAIAILGELEEWALELGFTRAVLETGTNQPEAIHLYKKMGYSLIENYGPYIGMDTSICMAKELDTDTE